jgi:hypothetical protein
MVTAGAKGLEERGQQQGWWVVVHFIAFSSFLNFLHSSTFVKQIFTSRL